MKTKLLTLALLASTSVMAQNPVIQLWGTPDPAPYVHNDTVYLFTDHDEDEDTGYFNMRDWQLYSSTDMVNWTYRGMPLTTATFSWARQGNDAWASQAIHRNGKWYWYVAAFDMEKGNSGIGVAVADHPEGPYTDPIGKPLVPGAYGFIDPSVFIDDDGQAYLFWGNNGLWYAPLNDDMVSLKEEFKEINTYDVSAFGPHKYATDWSKNMKRWMMGFEEAPWVYKRGNTYYMEYAAGGVPEHWAYSTAESIHGPWTYRGKIMGEAPNSFTIHGGSIEFHGRAFMFYHNGLLPNGGGFHRSTAIEEYTYNEDGSIPFIPFTDDGVKTPVRNLNPYQRVEAETMADCRGLKTDQTVGTEHYITSIHNGDWQRVRSVDFGKKRARTFLASVLGKAQNAKIEIRVDSPEGELLGTLLVAGTKGNWKTLRTRLKSIGGVHDVYFLYKGEEGELFDFDWWQLK